MTSDDEHDEAEDVPQQPQPITVYVSGSQGNLSESQKLSGADNYASWKFLMKAVLVAEGLWKVVQGQEDDEDRNDRALSKLCLNVKPQVHSVIMGIESASEIWEKLSNTYGDNGLLLRLRLLRSMFEVSLTSAGSMEAYLNCICSAQQRLAAMGHGLDDEFVAIIMLA